MHLLHITMSMRDNYIPGTKIDFLVLEYVGFEADLVTLYEVSLQLVRSTTGFD